MKVLLYGSRMFAGVLRHLAADCGADVVGCIDDTPDAVGVLGPFDAVRHSHPPRNYAVVNAVGYRNLKARRAVTERILAAGYDMPSLVHPRAYIAPSASIGQGCLIMSAAHVDVGVTIEAHVVIWPGVCVSHDSIVHSNTFLSPNCTICGDCRIGADSFVGAGAVVVSHQRVPAGTFIKAAERYVTR